MSDYLASWQPETIEQAEFLIDTQRAGDAFWQEGARLAELFSGYAPATAGTVVEYGCGVGRIIGQMTFRRRVGVDVSPQMVAFARDRYPDCEFEVCDGRSLPLDDGSAEFVFSLQALQHMDAIDVAAVVRDTARVLAAGGVACLSFSGFGKTWSPSATVERGPLVWNGGRAGSMSPAHGAIAYTEEIIEGLAYGAHLSVDRIEHEVVDGYHHNYLLVATR